MHASMQLSYNIREHISCLIPVSTDRKVHLCHLCQCVGNHCLFTGGANSSPQSEVPENILVTIITTVHTL